jgi:archaeosine synthase
MTTDYRILEVPAFYHPAFEEAHRFIIECYGISPRSLCIFLPCSMKKPYSASPSHILFDKVIERNCPSDHHIVVFGTCGVVPRELERMYPFSHYRYMLGKCRDQRVKRDFIEIETKRLVAYLKKTEHAYQHRIAYCLGDFRTAMERAVRKSGISVEILPSDRLIEKNRRTDIAFSQGSLSMEDYLFEFGEELGKKW